MHFDILPIIARTLLDNVQDRPKKRYLKLMAIILSIQRRKSACYNGLIAELTVETSVKLS